MHDADKTSMATLARVFPALAAVKKSDDEHISLVNEGIVEEVLLPLGELDFGKGQVGKCDISLWCTRGEHKSLVGEFAFQVKFPSQASVAEKGEKAGRTVLRHPAAGRARLDCAGRDQNGHGVSHEGERASKP
jgi:hypothetical protein